VLLDTVQEQCTDHMQPAAARVGLEPHAVPCVLSSLFQMLPAPEVEQPASLSFALCITVCAWVQAGRPWTLAATVPTPCASSLAARGPR
jgi:hypothetical protein